MEGLWAGFRPEVEGAHDEAALEKGPGYDVDNGVVIAPAQGRVRVRDNCAVLPPGRGLGGRRERLRMVDATVEGEAIVEAGEREGQGGLGKHGRREGRRLGHAGEARGGSGDMADDAQCRRCAGVLGLVGSAISTLQGPRGTGKTRQLWWG